MTQIYFLYQKQICVICACYSDAHSYKTFRCRRPDLRYLRETTPYQDHGIPSKKKAVSVDETAFWFQVFSVGLLFDDLHRSRSLTCQANHSYEVDALWQRSASESELLKTNTFYSISHFQTMNDLTAQV